MRYGIYANDDFRTETVYPSDPLQHLERAKETIRFLLKIIGRKRCQCDCVVCDRLRTVDVEYAPEKT